MKNKKIEDFSVQKEENNKFLNRNPLGKVEINGVVYQIYADDHGKTKHTKGSAPTSKKSDKQIKKDWNDSTPATFSIEIAKQYESILAKVTKIWLKNNCSSNFIQLETSIGYDLGEKTNIIEVYCALENKIDEKNIQIALHMRPKIFNKDIKVIKEEEKKNENLKEEKKEVKEKIVKVTPQEKLKKRAEKKFLIKKKLQEKEIVKVTSETANKNAEKLINTIEKDFSCENSRFTLFESKENIDLKVPEGKNIITINLSN